MTEGYKVKKKSLTLDSGVTVEFPHAVWKVVPLLGVFVVLLDTVGKNYPDNVFGVDQKGNKLWQIRPVRTPHPNLAFTDCAQSGQHVELYHMDGTLYKVNPLTGDILSSEFVK